MTSFGEWLAYWRVQPKNGDLRGWTQATLAETLGYVKSSVSKVEEGSEPSKSFCIAVSNLKELDLSDVLKEKFVELCLKNESPISALKDQGYSSSFILPEYATSFVGRNKELEDLEKYFYDPNVRLISIIGGPGMGKTRLATRVVNKYAQPIFGKLIYEYTLNSNQSEAQLLSSIATVVKCSFTSRLGQETTSNDLKSQLYDFLREKRLLLILNSFEHSVSQHGKFIADIIQNAPKILVLATSQEPLNLMSEYKCFIGPLDFPLSLNNKLSEFSAVTLFLDRAHQVANHSQISEKSLFEISNLLEGMPLAIELAADMLKHLSIEEIIDKLRHDITYVEANNPELEPHHRSVQALLDMAWSRLTEDEQLIFGQLTIFKGSFDLDSAAEILEIDRTKLEKILNHFVDKSLLHYPSARTQFSKRYRIHGLIRTYVRTKQLVNEELHQKHSQHYMRWMSDIGTHIRDEQVNETLSKINTDIDNVRIAWDWAVKNCNLKAIQNSLLSFLNYYDVKGQFEEGASLFGRAVDTIKINLLTSNKKLTKEQKILLGQLKAAEGWLCFVNGDPKTVEVCRESINLLEPLSKNNSIAVHPLAPLGITTCFSTGDMEEGLKMLNQSIVLQHEHRNYWGEAWANGFIAFMAFQTGDFDSSKTYYSKSLDLFDEVHDIAMIALAKSFIAQTELALDHIASAKKFLSEAIELSDSIDHNWTSMICLKTQAKLFFLEKMLPKARKAAEDALERAITVGEPWSVADVYKLCSEIEIETKHYKKAYQYICQGFPYIKSSKPSVALEYLVLLIEIFLHYKKNDLLLDLIEILYFHSLTTPTIKALAEKFLKSQSPDQNFQIELLNVSSVNIKMDELESKFLRLTL